MDAADWIARTQTALAAGGQNVPSPCRGLCQRVEGADGGVPYCAGCWRTMDEVMRWATASADERRAIWRALPGRARRARP